MLEIVKNRIKFEILTIMKSLAATLVVSSVAAATADLHPLLTAPEDVEFVSHPEGGFSIRLHPQKSVENTYWQDLSYLRNKHAYEKRRGKEKSLSTTIANWFGLTGAPINENYVLANADNLIYTGALTMGSTDASVNVVFDTGSLGLAVQGSTCTTNCAAAVYDETSSTAYVAGSTAWARTYKNSQESEYWINAVGIDADD